MNRYCLTIPIIILLFVYIFTIFYPGKTENFETNNDNFYNDVNNNLYTIEEIINTDTDLNTNDLTVNNLTVTTYNSKNINAKNIELKNLTTNKLEGVAMKTTGVSMDNITLNKELLTSIKTLGKHGGYLLAHKGNMIPIFEGEYPDISKATNNNRSINQFDNDTFNNMNNLYPVVYLHKGWQIELYRQKNYEDKINTYRNTTENTLLINTKMPNVLSSFKLKWAGY
jgi:hypothetical protein